MVWRITQQFRLMRFLSVGSMCGLIQIGLLFSFVKGLGLEGGWSQSVANTFAFALSAMVKFFLTQSHVYADKKHPELLWVRFAAWYPMQLVLTGANLAAFSLVNPSMDARLASAVSILATLGINWVVNVFVFQSGRLGAADSVAVHASPEENDEALILASPLVNDYPRRRPE